MTWYNITMNRAEKRSQKRKEVVEAVALRKEPVEVVARIHNIPLRTVFDWLARYRQGGWHALIEKKRQGRPTKVTADKGVAIFAKDFSGLPARKISKKSRDRQCRRLPRFVVTSFRPNKGSKHRFQMT